MIQPETQTDIPSVRAVHSAAFPGTAEADLVDALRANYHLVVSVVASDESQLVGHVAFSPVTIEGVELVGVGLAPVAVLPSHQGRGFGGQLIRAGLDACRELGIDYVVVLGHPTYYPRFGFTPASAFSLENEYGAGDEFMVIELTPKCLAGHSGLVQYGDEFRALA